MKAFLRDLQIAILAVGFWLFSLLGIAGLLVAFTGSARSATIEVADWYGGRQVLAIAGTIQLGDDNKLRKVIGEQGSLVDVVLLTSDGGDVDTAVVMAREINKLRVPVIVRGWCASACALMALSAGRRLVVTGSGQLAVHQVHDETGRADVHYTRGLARWLRSYRVPDSVLAKLVETPPSAIAVVSEDELLRMGATVHRYR